METLMADTRREALEAAFSEVEQPEVIDTAPETPAPVEAPSRARDEAGRFAKTETKPEAPAAPVEAVAAPEAPPARKPPSSWKKDYWDAYGKLEPTLQDYIEQREQQFANGVSVYKQEAERAKELHEALAPFMGDLQAHNIKPSQWITNLGTAHQRLAMGSPADKIQMFGKLAQDYGVSLPHLMQYLSGNPQALQGLPQPQAPQFDPNSIDRLLDQKLEQRTIQQEIAAMEADKANFPHFEAVKSTMSGLLQAGLADDLKSAYQIALSHPRHAEIQQAERQQREAAEAERIAAEKKALAGRARANNLSVKTATPASTGQVSGKKGLRDILAESVEQHMGAGRV